jgi:hypothetical protein
MKNIDFLFLIDKANKVLNNVKEFLTTNKDLFLTSTNLKLYDAFFNTENLDNFYIFCDCYFDQFKEDIKEQTGQDFYKLVHYIGRTSSFYCVNDDLYNNIITEKESINFNDTLYNLFCDLWGCNMLLNFNKTGGAIDTIELLKDIEAYDNDKHDTINQLNYIVSGEFLEDIKKTFKNSLIVFNTIKSYKEDQICAFNDFVTANEL